MILLMDVGRNSMTLGQTVGRDHVNNVEEKYRCAASLGLFFAKRQGKA